MNVLQLTKCKFKPVLDFREVNNYVLSHTGGGSKIDICLETLRGKSSNSRSIHLNRVGVPVKGEWKRLAIDVTHY